MKARASVRTLERWVNRGLIPEPKHQENGYRYYSDEELNEIKEFALKNKGNRTK